MHRMFNVYVRLPHSTNRADCPIGRDGRKLVVYGPNNPAAVLTARQVETAIRVAYRQCGNTVQGFEVLECHW